MESILKNKKMMSVIIIIGILIIGIIIFLSNPIGEDNINIDEQLSLGEKYLSELDYENAIIAFNKVINIDPMNVRAYIGLADAYIGLDDIDKAKEVLEEGVKRTDNTEMKAKLDKINRENEVLSSGVLNDRPEEFYLVLEKMFNKSHWEITDDDLKTIKFLSIGEIYKEEVRAWDGFIRFSKNDISNDIRYYIEEDKVDISFLVRHNYFEDPPESLQQELNNTEEFKTHKEITEIIFPHNEVSYDFISNIFDNIDVFSELTVLASESGVLENLTAISKLEKLVVLDLWDNWISDISSLSNLKDLQYLDLYFNNIEDISAISSMENLRYLRIDGNDLINDISPLYNLSNLEYLTIELNFDPGLSDEYIYEHINKLKDRIEELNPNHKDINVHWRTESNDE